MHKMKYACLALASSVTLAATAVTFTVGNSEVVIASKPPPVVRFAMVLPITRLEMTSSSRPIPASSSAL